MLTGSGEKQMLKPSEKEDKQEEMFDEDEWNHLIDEDWREMGSGRKDVKRRVEKNNC